MIVGCCLSVKVYTGKLLATGGSGVGNCNDERGSWANKPLRPRLGCILTMQTCSIVPKAGSGLETRLRTYTLAQVVKCIINELRIFKSKESTAFIRPWAFRVIFGLRSWL